MVSPNVSKKGIPMSKFKSILVAGAALIATSGAALATDGGVGNFNNLVPQLSQFNPAAVFATTKLYAEWVGGDLRAAATAVGNNLSLDFEGSTHLALVDQLQMGDVGAGVKVHGITVEGDVDLSATGICNNAAIANSKSDKMSGTIAQRCQTFDPYASIDASFVNVGGGVGANATAVSNNLSMDLATTGTDLRIAQSTAAATLANVNVNLGSVGGSVDVSATAIGNNISIKHVLGY